MQSKLFFLTLAFVFSISFALSQSLAPLDTIPADTMHVFDNVPEWNWDKSPDSPISIEDDFAHADKLKSVLTPSCYEQYGYPKQYAIPDNRDSKIGMPQGILFRIFVRMTE